VSFPRDRLSHGSRRSAFASAPTSAGRSNRDANSGLDAFDDAFGDPPCTDIYSLKALLVSQNAVAGTRLFPGDALGFLPEQQSGLTFPSIGKDPPTERDAIRGPRYRLDLHVPRTGIAHLIDQDPRTDHRDRIERVDRFEEALQPAVSDRCATAERQGDGQQKTGHGNASVLHLENPSMPPLNPRVPLRRVINKEGNTPYSYPSRLAGAGTGPVQHET